MDSLLQWFDYMTVPKSFNKFNSTAESLTHTVVLVQFSQLTPFRIILELLNPPMDDLQTKFLMLDSAVASDYSGVMYVNVAGYTEQRLIPFLSFIPPYLV